MLKNNKLKFLILLCLIVFKSNAQVVQTFPIGFHSLESAQSITPEYAEAITQASQLVGRVLSDRDNGTAYLYYNDDEQRWEAHSAYHVVEEGVEAGLPLVMELPDKTGIILDPKNIISSDNEHAIQDRVRYTLDYTREKPDKILFKNSISIGSGASILVIGYPKVMIKPKVSFGHAIVKNDGFWLSTATTQAGSSGSAAFQMAQDGQLVLGGTIVIAKYNPAFMAAAYKVKEELLFTVLTQYEFNQWIYWVSNQNKGLSLLTKESDQYFSNKFQPYKDKITEYPSGVGLWYQFDQQKIINELETILLQTKMTLQRDPKLAIETMMKNIKAYYMNTNNVSATFSVIDFPLVRQDEIQVMEDDRLKQVLESELDQSIADLAIFRQRLDHIKSLFEVGQLSEVIENILSLNIKDNEENFGYYNIPSLTLISSYQ